MSPARTAVITGGARGFGAAFGRALAAEGATVVLVDTDGDAATRMADSLREGDGRGVTLSFAAELGPKGIRVNAISPGMIFTDTIREGLSPENKALAKSMQAIEADGSEADVVAAMMYLASASARFVTGEILRVTGGWAPGSDRARLDDTRGGGAMNTEHELGQALDPSRGRRDRRSLVGRAVRVPDRGPHGSGRDRGAQGAVDRVEARPDVRATGASSGNR